MTYEEKKEIADRYISDLTEGFLTWDTLPDINSLHDYDTEEGIREACDERLGEEGFPV